MIGAFCCVFKVLVFSVIIGFYFIIVFASAFILDLIISITIFTVFIKKKVEKIKSNGFKSFYSNLYNFMLTKNLKNLCTLDEALHVIKVCEAVKKCAKNKRVYII